MTRPSTACSTLLQSLHTLATAASRVAPSLSHCSQTALLRFLQDTADCLRFFHCFLPHGCQYHVRGFHLNCMWGLPLFSWKCFPWMKNFLIRSSWFCLGSGELPKLCYSVIPDVCAGQPAHITSLTLHSSSLFAPLSPSSANKTLCFSLENFRTGLV